MSSAPTVTDAIREPRWSWGLPLLAKDLTELAARRRTYQIRIGYAAALLFISLMVLVSSVNSKVISSVMALGAGKPVFSTLVALQEFGLFLVLPVLACTTLTVEKERKTLDLLLITKLGPWTIVVEKFLSVFVLALNFLLLSLPVLAFSYAFGGISLDELWLATLEFALTSARIAAIGVMCSAAFATSSRAWGMMYLLLPIMLLIESGCQYLAIPAFRRGGLSFGLLEFELPFFRLLRSNLVLACDVGINLPLRMLIGALSSLSFSLIFLQLARWFLVPPRWLKALQSFGARLVPFRSRERPALERTADFDDPITWREAPRGSLVRWWIRNCLVASVPVILILEELRFIVDSRQFQFAASLVSTVLWLVLTVRICSQASCLFVVERIHQTLDVLRCTPLSASDIVQQKMQQIWRTVAIGRVTLVTCVVVRSIPSPNVVYLIGAAVAIAVYPVLIAWQAATCGATARNGAMAILKSLLTLTGWCIIPLIVCCPLPVASPLPLLAVIEQYAIYGADRDFFGDSPDLPLIFGVLLTLTAAFQWFRAFHLRSRLLELADLSIRTVPIPPRVGELRSLTIDWQAPDRDAIRVNEDRSK